MPSILQWLLRKWKIENVPLALPCQSRRPEGPLNATDEFQDDQEFATSYDSKAPPPFGNFYDSLKSNISFVCVFFFSFMCVCACMFVPVCCVCTQVYVNVYVYTCVS